MGRLFRLWPLVLIVCVLAASAVYAALRLAGRPARPRAGRPSVPATQVAAQAEARDEQVLRYLAIGGGSTPESTEVSLEQNLALAAEVLGGPGALLFGGGPGSLSVRELDPSEPGDALLVRLGDLFQPRGGRGSRYRASTLSSEVASRERVEAELSAALTRGKTPLLMYIAAHGEQGEGPRDNSIVLWGGERMSVARIAELHEAHPRPLRLLSASCYSGGFAELAFAGADSERGAALVPRCGLFAGTADRETSGCDPNPDRRAQESYSLHLLHALRGRDRDGQRLELAALDGDRDGRVSLLEAHIRASASAQSIDVPTTTSERYLREVQKEQKEADASLLPEHTTLVQKLGAELDLPTSDAVRDRFEDLSSQLNALDDRLDAAGALLEKSFGALSGRLLGRWPVLDDAYHPQFAEMLERNRSAIKQALDSWPEAKRFEANQRAYDALDAELQTLELAEAKLLRLLRAHETLGLAAALKRRGGAPWEHFATLLACERYVP